jgi:hypothetical protein
MNTRSLVYALAVAFAFSALSVANAQQPPQPPFEPYIINAQEHQGILNYLGDVPSKYANPIISQLMQMEQQAQQKKAVADAKAKDVAPKKPDVSPLSPTPLPTARPKPPVKQPE